MKKIILVFALLVSFAAVAQKKAIPATDYCSQIEIEKGKPEGETHYVTPTLDGLSIKKIKRADSQSYICTLKAVSQTKQEGTFAVIMFDNGKSIDKPDARIVEGVQKDKHYEYYALFMIDEQEMNLFNESTVKGIMLMDEVVLPKQKVNLQKLMTCLINK